MKMRALKMRTIFVCLKLTLIWKRLLRKTGGPRGLDGHLHRRIMYSFNFFTVATQRIFIINIKKFLGSFILKRLGDLRFFEMVHEFKIQMTYI